jgi:hypothetical protein
MAGSDLATRHAVFNFVIDAQAGIFCVAWTE